MYEEIIDVIGKEAADKFVRAFGGGIVYVDSPRVLDLDIRRNKIKKLHRDGVCIKEIAKICGISSRSVYRVISK